MLTRDAMFKTMKHQHANGEGKHRFGLGHERLVPVPRDVEARPKIISEEESKNQKK